MAVQIPDPGTGNGQTGDNEYVFRKKVRDNFSDQNNAASRLVGLATGNVMAVGSFGLGSSQPGVSSTEPTDRSLVNQLRAKGTGTFQVTTVNPAAINYAPGFCITTTNTIAGITIGHAGSGGVRAFATYDSSSPILIYEFYTNRNTIKDSNGFLKGASPVVNLYSDNISLNDDALEQPITFEKLGVGDYLVQGSLGFAQEGWYIEIPKDANGNVLVAVVYEQLENNDISVKTYAKTFDIDTGDIVANSDKPRDIPDGRFISLRLHELPDDITQEPLPE